MPHYKLSPIPDPPKDASPELRRLLLALKEATEVRNGVRGDPLESLVTKKDLVEGGLAEAKPLGSSGGVRVSIGTGGKGQAIERIQTPTTPVLTARGVFGGVFLGWNDPASAYNGHLHTEIWVVRGSKTSDRMNAEHVASATGFNYVFVNTDTDVTEFTFWVRFRNRANQFGAFSAPATADQVPDVDQIMDKIRGKVASSEAVEVLYKDLEVVNQGLQEEQGRARLLVGDGDTVGGMSIVADGERKAVDFAIRADTFSITPNSTDGKVAKPFVVKWGQVGTTGSPNRRPVMGWAVFLDNAYIDQAFINSIVAKRLTVGEAGANPGTEPGALFHTDVEFANTVRMNGNVAIQNANIRDTISSKNASGMNTWELNQDGTFRIQGGDGGGSISITANGIEIKDGTRVRVRIGKLN